MNLKSTFIGLAVGLLIFLSIPNSIFSFYTKGSGNVIKEIRKVETFNKIEAGGAFDIVIVKGDNQSLVIKTDDNIMSKITTKVSGGELRISTKGNINNATTMKVFITMKELKGIDLSGACSLVSESRFENDKMEIEMSGAANSELKISCKNLDIEISGAATTNLSGYATELKAEVSGAGNLKAYDLELQTANIDCSGAATTKIFVTKSLKAEASGASNVYYKGNPKQVSVNTSGAGSIKRK